MRWMSFCFQGKPSFGYLKNGGELVDVGIGSGLDSLKQALRQCALEELVAGSAKAPIRSLGSVKFLPPIPNPDKILCVGLNYRDHQAETGKGGEDYPTIFVRFANSQVGHNGEMVRPRESSNLDYEGEIALVVGKSGRRIDLDESLNHVFGYSIYNDGSVRDYQSHTSQFTPGKNFIQTGGFGPWVVTPDEIDNLDSMTLSTFLNGERMQYANASQLVFGFDELIAYCSTFTELDPGDVIVTGTPGGVGASHKPPKFMDDGDVVEVSVEPIGSLRLRVVVG